ncbi:hypothetical protein J7K86_01725 [bacterium]|nr:hypothetical protein [bacterium]
MKKFLTWFIGWLVVSGISYYINWGLIILDIKLNPWIKNVKFHPSLFFTTRHALSILYINNPLSALMLNAILITGIFGIITIALYKQANKNK